MLEIAGAEPVMANVKRIVMPRLYPTAAFVLYCWIPVVLAIFSLVGSALVFWKERTILHFCLTGTVFVGEFSSLLMLYGIFYLGAAESLLPHFSILAAFAIFAGQAFYALKRNRNSA